jgi:AAA domain/DnaB-like helicase N terminal domain
MSALKIAYAQKKNKVVEFFANIPKLDNGKPDWNTVAENYNLNDSDLGSFIFGKLPPQAIALEEGLLCACLVDAKCYFRVKPILGETKDVFYKEIHNTIFSAIAQLGDVGKPIDLWTVTEVLMRRNELEQIGGAYHLTEITNIGSSEHAEYYAQVLLEKKHYRDYIALFSKYMRNCYEEKVEPFQMREDIISVLLKEEIDGGAFETLGMAKTMMAAGLEEDQLRIAGDFLKTGDLAIWFAAQKTGKSIAGVQLADKISKGEALFKGGILPNEAGQLKVVYFDFELSLKNYKKRYTDAANKLHDFNDAFYIRKSIKKDFCSYDKLPEYIMGEMQRAIVKENPDVIVVDNITFLTSGGTDDGEKSKAIMTNIKHLKDKYNKTVLVLAHAKKYVDSTRPLTIEDMFGSSMIGNFCTTIVGLRRSASSPNVIYWKHCIDRDIEVEFDEKKVILTYIEKKGTFLGFHILNPDNPTAHENEHLRSFKDADNEKDSIEEMIRLKKDGKSLRDISAIIYGEALRDKKFQTVRNKIAAYEQGIGFQPELQNVDQATFDKLDSIKTDNSELPF